jgi:hypothetical protein
LRQKSDALMPPLADDFCKQKRRNGFSDFVHKPEWKWENEFNKHAKYFTQQSELRLKLMFLNIKITQQ